MYSANTCWLITFHGPIPGTTLCGKHKTHWTSLRNSSPLEGPGMHHTMQNMVFIVTFRFQVDSLKEAFLSRCNPERHEFWQQSPMGKVANKWHEIIRQKGWSTRRAKANVPPSEDPWPSPWPSHLVLRHWIFSRVIRVHMYQSHRGWRITVVTFFFFFNQGRGNNIPYRYKAWEKNGALCARDFWEGPEDLSDCREIVAQLKCRMTHSKTFLSPEPLKQVCWN